MRVLVVALLLGGCHQPPRASTLPRRARPAAPAASIVLVHSEPSSAPTSVPASQPHRPRPPLLPSGSLDHTQIRAVIEGRAAQVRECYLKHSVRRPPRAASVHVRLVVDVHGDVKEVRIEESTLTEPAVKRCLLAEIARWPFPKPRGGEVVVQTPLYFDQAR